MSVDIVLSRPGYTRNLTNLEQLAFKMRRGPHGDDLVDFQLCDWSGQLPHMGDLLTVFDTTYGYSWSGYIAGPTIPGFFGGAAPCDARGWRHSIPDDGWETTRIWAEGTPLSTVVMEALTKCSHINAGISLPGGLSFQLSADSPDYILRAPDDVFDFVSDKFKFLTTPLLWEVKQNYQHPMNNDPTFIMRFADLAPRYFVTLTENDEFKPKYDRDVVYNKALVGWSPKLAEDEIATPASELYKVIPHIRAKRLQGSNEFISPIEAARMAQYLIQRNNTLRPINTQLKIHCDTPIRAIYPVVPASDSNVPHHFVQSNYVIRIENDMTAWAPYNVRDYWITDTQWDMESGDLTLTIGDPIAYDDWEVQQSYATNRINSSISSSAVNAPLGDADVIPVIGPDKAGDSPPTIGQVIPMAYLDQDGNFISVVDPDKPALPYGAVIHPKVLPDYGVQANFGREADSIGTKGFIQVVPCKVLAWNICFTPPAGSDTVPTDSMTVQLYPTYPFTVGVNVLATCVLSAEQCESGTIAPVPASLALFQQRGKIGVRVSSAASTVGCGFQVAITGKRVYPDLGVTT